MMKKRDNSKREECFVCFHEIFGKDAPMVEVGGEDAPLIHSVPVHSISLEDFNNQTDRYAVVSFIPPWNEFNDPQSVLDTLLDHIVPGGVFLTRIPASEIWHTARRPLSYGFDILRKKTCRSLIFFDEEAWYGIFCQTLSDQWETLAGRLQSILCPDLSEVTITGSEVLIAQKKLSADSDTTRLFFYLLNPSPMPLELTLSCRRQGEEHPDIFLESLKLRYEKGLQEDKSWKHQWTSVLIPPGGHELTFHFSAENGGDLHLELIAAEIPSESFLRRLAFDHYQRYRLMTDILKAAFDTSLSILDIGGAHGFLSLFIPDRDITVVDVAMEDAPYAVQYDGHALPYDDNYFDLAVSLDTLEHIPAAHRDTFLYEISRVARHGVVICCPFADDSVQNAEAVLQDFILHQLHHTDRFLEEHQNFILPEQAQTIEVLKNQGFDVVVLPSGYLPRWLGMQMVSYAMGVSPEQQDGKQRMNALYNTHMSALDNRNPAYRKAIIAKKRFDETQRVALQSLVSPVQDPPTSFWDELAVIVATANYRVIQEKDRDVSAFGERLGRILEHVRNLESALQEERDERNKLRLHADNLQIQSKGLNSLLLELQKDSENYRQLSYDLQRSSTDILRQKDELNAHQADLMRHAENLQTELAEWRKHSQNLHQQLLEKDQHAQHVEERLISAQQHAVNLEALRFEIERHSKNLETALAEISHHAENLESALAEKSRHAENLESALAEKSRHAENLESALAEKSRHAENLEQIITEKDKHIVNMETLRNSLETECAASASRIVELQNTIQQREGELFKVQQDCAELNTRLGKERDEKLRILHALHGIQNHPLYRLLSIFRLAPRNDDR